jgi:hypothetical protein
MAGGPATVPHFTCQWPCRFFYGVVDVCFTFAFLLVADVLIVITANVCTGFGLLLSSWLVAGLVFGFVFFCAVVDLVARWSFAMRS